MNPPFKSPYCLLTLPLTHSCVDKDVDYVLFWMEYGGLGGCGGGVGTRWGKDGNDEGDKQRGSY